MFRYRRAAAGLLCYGLFATLGALAQPGAAAGPVDAKAAKAFAKAARELEARKYAAALDDFKKADGQDGGRCAACEIQAYKAANLLEDYKEAQEQAALVLKNAAGPEDKAEAHTLAGEACLAEGGYRIFEEPFQAAESHFSAAIELGPKKPDCFFDDGLALAHLHQYAKAQERFQEFLKVVSPDDLRYARARLFATQPELARKRTAPDFSVVGLDGKPISMKALAGKVVLIDFWATWCGPCKRALPHLKAIAQQFAGEPLVVVSVSLDADENAWKDFVAKNGMTWAQFRDGGFEGPMATDFRVKAIPTTFTIDKDGFVQDQQVGDGEIESKLKKLVAQAEAANKTVAEVR